MSETLRLLLIEDSESDAGLTVRHLKKSGYLVESERVEDSTAMRDALAREPWDVVIADYQLPQFGAVEALQIRNQIAPDVPFIVVSGTIGDDRAVDMMRAGAQDYVLKDRMARLPSAVQRVIQEAHRIHEHRCLADRLRDRDEWLALAVGTTQLGMFDFYPQSGTVVLTESAHLHVGLPPTGETRYQEIVNALHPGDRERVSELILTAFEPAGGGFFAADFRVIGLDDQVERWLSVQGRVLFDKQGQPTRCVGVTIDISQRKQLEARLTLLDRAKSDFLSLISHEFRTPLNGILGVGDQLLAEMPHSENSKMLQGIFERGRHRILSILDDAVLLAEINVNEERFKFTVVPLYTALNRGMERAAEFAKSRRVTIAPLSAFPGCVLVNEELLVRSFQALLETAVKFSDHGETVRLSHCLLPHATQVVIETAGRSIPGASVDKFFGTFAVGETITPGGDLGLRLPVACRILSLFGASVSVENRDAPEGIRLTVCLKDAASAGDDTAKTGF